MTSPIPSPTILPFAPPAWFRNAHLQSILPSLQWRRSSLHRRAQSLLRNSREYILDCGDGVRLLGVYSGHESTDGRSSRPLAMLMHGWEGSADSLYLLSLGAHLYRHGFNIFRLNFRDHGPTHQLNRDLFHSCRIAEVVGAVRAVQDLFTPPTLNLAGFSLGGNFALRVAARAPQAGIRLHRAVAICPVLSPHRTLEAMEAGWFVYEQYFVRKWKHSLRLKARCFPGQYDFRDIMRMNTLKAMTDVLVQRHTDFATLDNYLNGYAIVDDALRDLNVESHLILAGDDPIIPAADNVQLAPSSYLNVNVVPNGGHCGFIDRLRGESWADRAVLQILSRESSSSENHTQRSE